ncbi:hypothetical protein ES708_33103 [subsurface metagenome]
MYRHKKSPTYIEQLNRLLHEVDYHHFLNTANIRTIFQPRNIFVIFSINLRFARKKACANGYYFDILETKKAIHN